MILEINGRRVEVADSFRSLTPDQQQATVDEIAASMPAATPAPTPEPADPGAMAWLNRGIASGIDALAGTANRGVNAAIRGGADVLGIEDPYQFNTAPTANLMDVAGIEQAQGAPETMGQRALVGAGEAAGMMLPFGAAARGVAGMGGVAGGVGQAMQTTGLRGMGAELAAGAGAGVGGQIAADAAGGGYGEIARPVGELAGALVGAMGPGAAMRGAVRTADMTTRVLPVAGTVRAAIEREITPFTRRGATEIARSRFRNLAQDPEQALARLDPNSPLTPAQQTGDPNLMALERGVIAQNPQMQPEFEARNIAAQRELAATAAENTAPVGQAREFIQRRTEAVVARLDNRVQRAEQAAQERIARLEPNRPAAANSQIVREELDKAYAAAKQDERALWDRVPNDVEVPTQNARAAYVAETERAGPVRTDLLPDKARQFLGGNGFGGQAPMRDMKALYSELRQTARNARSGPTPNAFTASSADALADAILRDMDDLAATNPGVNEAYQAARSYTARMKETFGQGAVGRARTRSAAGGTNIDPALVLDRTVGVGGTRGAVALDDFRGAVGAAADEPVTDYMRGQLARRGDFTPQRGEAFMRQNPEMMQRLPDLAADVQGAGQAAEFAAQRSAQNPAAALTDPRRAAGAAFTQARPGEEVNRAIFQAQNPIAAARQIARQAQRDQSGVAVRGLKGGALDYLMGRAAAGYSPTGDRLISGDVLNGLLKDRQTRGALAQIYDAAELGRLDRIAGELQKLEISRNVAPMAEIVDVTPNKMIQYIGGVFAARSGARLGAGTSGASLKTSSMATQRFNAILQRLTSDRAEAMVREAILDNPMLFRDLMTPMNTPERARQVERRVSEWLQGYTAGVVAGDEQMNEER
ncbi:structural protein [Paracoccus phage vB_PmaP_KLEP18-1]|nr:structural protein [Paracoccus phage vB_PmaP_KLEP18-1]